MKRDLNELYNMVCNDSYEYSLAVQAVVTFSGLHGQELEDVMPTYKGKTSSPQSELTIHDVRGYTPYYERDMSPYEGGQPLDDIIMGGSESPDIIADYPDFFNPIMPDSEVLLGQEVFNLDNFGGEQVDVSDVTFTFSNTEFKIL